MFFSKPKLSEKILFQHQLPIDIEDIPGWFSEKEATVLYNLARDRKGPILEIGSWAGRSTLSLAAGIRDSKKQKEFNTVELNPTLGNFRRKDDRVYFYEHPKDKRPLLSVTIPEFVENIKPVVEAGIITQLKSNLSEAGLLGYVHVVEGNFRIVAPVKTYDFIFCDVMHNPHEIDLNAPYLAEMLTKGSILACHDIDEKLIPHLRKYLSLKRGYVIDQLVILLM